MRGLINKKVRFRNLSCFSQMNFRKRGASHFEMIISFMFFLGFVFFIFIILKPYDTSVMSNTAVIGFYDSFEEKMNTNLSNIFLKANYAGEEDCFYIQLPEDVFVYDIEKGNSYVTKLTGAEIDSKLNGVNLNIKSGESFFRIAISPEFEEGHTDGCEILGDYELGQPVGREVFSYSALMEINESYFNSYEELKEELRVPPILDFAIVFEDLPIKMEPRHGTPDLVDVMAQEYVAGVLKSNGNLTNERFILKIW